MLAFLFIIVLGGLSFHFYKASQLKATLKPLVLKDNELFGQFLKSQDYYGNKYTILISKAEESISERSNIIQNIASVSPYIYKKKVDTYLEMLNLENNCSKSAIGVWNGILEHLENLDENNKFVRDMTTVMPADITAKMLLDNPKQISDWYNVWYYSPRSRGIREMIIHKYSLYRSDLQSLLVQEERVEKLTNIMPVKNFKPLINQQIYKIEESIKGWEKTLEKR